MMQSQKISEREQEVLKMIADEYSMQSIASKLYISHHTVISHRKNLKKKLSAKNSAGLIRRAFELGILSITSSANVA